MKVKSMAGRASPSPRSGSCGRAAADHLETGCQSTGVPKGTGWWTLCAGQNVAAQPSERWTGTKNNSKQKGKDPELSLFYVT